MIKLHGPLYSGNAEQFVMKVRKLLLEADLPQHEHELNAGSTMVLQSTNSSTTTIAAGNEDTAELNTIVVECSCVNFVDIVGAQAMGTAMKLCRERKIKLRVADC